MICSGLSLQPVGLTARTLKSPSRGMVTLRLDSSDIFRSCSGPIRDEHSGHVTRCPPTTAHLVRHEDGARAVGAGLRHGRGCRGHVLLGLGHDQVCVVSMKMLFVLSLHMIVYFLPFPSNLMIGVRAVSAAQGLKLKHSDGKLSRFAYFLQHRFHSSGS